MIAAVATYYILAALLDAPMHGYAIIKHAAQASQGRVNLAVGTLYGALDRLVAGMSPMSAPSQVLRRRYQRLLAVYPSDWRAANETVVLGTLLEAARPTRRWPSLRETLALLVGGAGGHGLARGRGCWCPVETRGRRGYVLAVVRLA